MRISLIKLVFLGISMFCFFNGIGQSIGYSFSYTLPYEVTDNFVSFGESLIDEKYKKRADFSIGVSLNSYTDKIYSVQIRLSKYSSSIIAEKNFGVHGLFIREIKTDRFYLELEGYFVSKNIQNCMFFNFGVNYAYLLNYNFESYRMFSGIKTTFDDANFGNPTKYNFELLLKLNWQNIELTKDLSLVPSYVFGYGLLSDFRRNDINTTAINHRFEISIFKNLENK